MLTLTTTEASAHGSPAVNSSPQCHGMETTTTIESLLTIEQVAQRLGVQVRHVRRLVAERRIPYLKWGHLLRFDPQELQAWLDAARVTTLDSRRR